MRLNCFISPMHQDYANVGSLSSLFFFVHPDAWDGHTRPVSLSARSLLLEYLVEECGRTTLQTKAVCAPNGEMFRAKVCCSDFHNPH